MLSAQSYSFRQNTRLAISLSWIGGYVNVIALLTFGHVISHMTGNTTFFGVSLIHAIWHDAAYFGFSIIMFLLGATLSALLTESTRRRGAMSNYILPMAVEAVLLAMLAVTINRVTDIQNPGYVTLYFGTALACLAMGLQNATITKISGAVVRTTHITGVLTDLGLEGVQLFLWYRDRMRGLNVDRAGRVWRVSQRHPTFLRVLLLASIFGSFIFGATVGATIQMHWPRYVLVPPILFLLWIIVMDYLRPIAALEELDVLGDPELKLAGILKHMLPPELGIYRMSCHRGQRSHQAPNFQAWVDLLPDQWTVVILALSHWARLDENAIADLQKASQRLRAQGRTLIISGLTTQQFRQFDAMGAVEGLGFENLCPDLEFAVARGIDLLRESSAARSEMNADSPVI